MPFGDKNINVMRSLVPQWKRVAILLGFNPVRVDFIETNSLPPHQVEKACTMMLRDWIESDGATWSALLELLVHITEIRLASDLREALLI